MYDYREMTPEQRREIVEHRRRQQRPWHSPPPWDFQRERQFIRLFKARERSEHRAFRVPTLVG